MLTGIFVRLITLAVDAAGTRKYLSIDLPASYLIKLRIYDQIPGISGKIARHYRMVKSIC